MANTKITELTALTQCAATDVLPIVKVSANTTKKVSISDLLRNAPAGTASAPGIANADDQDTGILFPAANSIGVSTGGAQRLVIDSSGRVGIGTTSPGAALDVVGNSTMLRLYDGTNTSTGKISQSSNVITLSQAGTSSGALAFATGSGALGTERMRIDGSGNVGIGVSSPSAPLHTVAGGEFDTSDSTDFTGVGLFLQTPAGLSTADGTYGAALAWSRPTDTGRFKTAIAPVQTGSDLDLQGLAFFTANSTSAGVAPSERMRIDSSGNVGIGTSSPDALLNLEATTSASLRIKNTTNNTPSVPHIELLNNNNEGLDITINRSGVDSRAKFAANTAISVDTNGSERLRIDSSGRLLVGTTSARTNLFAAFAPAQQIEGTTANTSRQSITRNSNSAGSEPALIFGKSRGTSNGSNTVVSSGDRLGALEFSGADGTVLRAAASVRAEVDGTPGDADMPGRLLLSTTADGASSPTERMRIDSSGNVGIGTGTITNPYSQSNFTNVNIDGTWGGIISFKLGGVEQGWIGQRSSGNQEMIVGASSNKKLLFATNGNNERARIDSSGRILINHSSSRAVGAARIVQIEGTSDATAGVSLVRNSNNSSSPTINLGKSRGTSTGSNTVVQSGDGLGSIYFRGADGTDLNTIGAAIEAAVDSTPGANDMPGRLVFSTTVNGGSTPTERMRINNGGRVLIGTTSVLETTSAARLQIAHTSGALLALGRNDAAVTNGNDMGKIAFYGNDGGGYEKVAQILCEADGSHASGDKPGKLIFQTTADNASSPSERMRIDSSGRVGIATTPEAWSGFDALEVNEASIVSSGSGDAFFTANAYYDGAWKYKDAGVARNIYMNSDGIVFRQAASGSADASVAWSESMRIDSSGRLGVGTSSPTERLTVGAGSGPEIILVRSGSVNTGELRFSDTGDNNYQGALIYSHVDNSMQFATNGAGERMRIDSSGRLLIGSTSARANFYHSVVSPQVQQEGTGDFDRQAAIISSSSTGHFGAAFILAHQKSGSTGGNIALANSDVSGLLSFQANDGSHFLEHARIQAFVDGASGTDDMPGALQFFTAADGAQTVTEAFNIRHNGEIESDPTYANTTAGAANVHITSSGFFARSTSSGKYKTNIETLEDSYADAILDIRPVWYRSTCEKDNSEHGWWGFIAEEVAAVDPRLVHWKTVEVSHDEEGRAVKTPCDPEPEGVAYDRFVPHLLNLIKRQQSAIETLEAKVAALEAQ